MYGDGALDAVPLWALFFLILMLTLASFEGGSLVGRYRRARSEREKEPPVAGMVAATLGLLAFMLAFTFSLAATRFDTRRQVLLDEANAIGTTYLRAGTLPERRDETRALLREYVDTRLEAVRSKRIDEGMRRSEQIQNALWSHATALATANPQSIIVGLFIQSLNETIDLHAKRMTVGLRNRVPGVIWTALFAMAVLSFGEMGYHAGLLGTTRSLAVVAVAFTFSAVIVLIADLDRPHEGSLTVSQQPLIDVRRSMGEPGP